MIMVIDPVTIVLCVVLVCAVAAMAVGYVYDQLVGRYKK